MENTKNNHFVPQFYLKNFCDDNKFVYKGDLAKNNFYKVSDLRSECSRKNIYTVKEKISQKDFKLFCELFNMQHYLDNEFAHILIKYLNDEIADLFLVTTKNKEIEKKFNDELKARINNPDYSRTQENLFTFIYENDFRDLYEKILKEREISFISQTSSEQNINVYCWIKISAYIYKQIIPKTINAFKKLKADAFDNIPKIDYLNYQSNFYYDFLHFILIQYFRTEKIIESQKETFKKVNIKGDNLIFLLIHLKTIELADILIKENYKIILVENISNKDFIISDCPCTNIYARFVKDRPLENDEFELYVPLSSKLAIICTKRDCYKTLTNSKIFLSREKDIDMYNQVSISNAKRFIYGSNEDLIKEYALNQEVINT